MVTTATIAAKLSEKKTKEENDMNASELAIAMLNWEQKKNELDALELVIKAAVLEMGNTQTVGNVRATYSGGRKSYD